MSSRTRPALHELAGVPYPLEGGPSGAAVRHGADLDIITALLVPKNINMPSIVEDSMMAHQGMKLMNR